MTLEELEIVAPAHERGHAAPPALGRLRAADESVRPRPGTVRHRQRDQLEAALEQRHRRLAHDDHVAVGSQERVEHPARLAHAVDDRGPAAEADLEAAHVNRQLDGDRLALRAGALGGLLERHRRVRRALGRVLHRLQAEGREHTRRAPLLDSPAEDLDLVDGEID